jgi:prepilin-type N-terminal cleavage/methylation domain-containing protein
MRSMEKRLRERLEAGEGGFTLIELLVVMLIIGILLAIAIPTFLSVVNNAHNTSVESNLGNAIIEASANYTQDNSQFGQSVGSLVSELTAGETSFKYAAMPNSGGTAQNVIYVAAVDCTGTGGPVPGIDTNAADNGCQGIAMQGWSPQTSVCYMVIVLKAAITPAVNVLGYNLSNPGTYYGDVTSSTAAGCGQTVTASNWQSNGFPPVA